MLKHLVGAVVRLSPCFQPRNERVVFNQTLSSLGLLLSCYYSFGDIYAASARVHSPPLFFNREIVKEVNVCPILSTFNGGDHIVILPFVGHKASRLSVKIVASITK